MGGMAVDMGEPRLLLLPAPKFVPLVPELQRHLAMAADSINAENFASLLDGSMRRLIASSFELINASEGSIWLHDGNENCLVIAFNTGPNSGQLVGKFKQPLTAGIVSMVFSSEQSFVENDVYKNSQHDKNLDSMLRHRTQSMIVTPMYFLAGCRGVISCVQLQGPEKTERLRGFSEHDLVMVRHAAGVLGKLVDGTVLRAVVGLG